MRSAVLFIITGLVLSPAPKATAAAKSDGLSVLASSEGLVRQKEPVPDDPLAGLPTSSAGDENNQHDRAKPTSKSSRSCRLNANPANARNVGDLRATLAFVQRGPQAWPCPQPGQSTEVRLRVAVDVEGRITDVQPAGGDATVAGGLAQKLVGQSIAPRPQGPTQGTVVLSFAAGRK
jgi:hypothetical protein